MASYVALLRGINVGGAHPVPMAGLRAALAEHGAANVVTLLQSGNVVLEADEDEDGVKALVVHALRRFQLDVPVVVLDAATFLAVQRDNPLVVEEPQYSRLLCYFLDRPLNRASLESNDPRVLDPNAALGERAVYQWCPAGVSEAPALGTFLERRFGIVATGRNWRTVCRIAALLDRRDP